MHNYRITFKLELDIYINKRFRNKKIKINSNIKMPKNKYKEYFKILFFVWYIFFYKSYTVINFLLLFKNNNYNHKNH